MPAMCRCTSRLPKHLSLLVVLLSLLLSGRPAFAADIPAWPEYLYYSPTDVEVTNDDVLLLLDTSNRAIHRWDLANQRYLPSLASVGASELMYDPILHRVYLWRYPGDVGYIDLGSDALTPKFFVSGLTDWFMPSVVAPYLLGSRSTTGSSQLFAPDGSVHATLPAGTAAQGHYDSARKRIYFSGPAGIFHVPLSASGQPGASSTPIPFEGEQRISAIDPVSGLLFLESGLVIEPDTGAVRGNLGGTFDDFPGVWLSGRLYTLEEVTVDNSLKLALTVWDEHFRQLKRIFINERGHFMGARRESNEIIVVSHWSAVPRIETYTTDLELIQDIPPTPRSPSLCTLQSILGTYDSGILLECRSSLGVRGTQVVERSVDGINWSVVGTMDTTSDVHNFSYTDTNLVSDLTYYYRVYAEGNSERDRLVVPVQVKLEYVDHRLPYLSLAYMTVYHQFRSEVYLEWRVDGRTARLDGYFVERSADDRKTWNPVARVPPDQTHVRDFTPLADAAHYEYRVRGYNAYGMTSHVPGTVAVANVLLPERRPPLFSSSTRFDRATGVLNIPCVNLIRNAVHAGYYKVALIMEGARLRVTRSEAITAPDTCTGSFDADSGIYTDSAVRYDDDIYSVRLQRQEDKRFTIESTAFQREGQTFLWEVRDGDRVLYLGGTPQHIHQLHRPHPEPFLEAYAAADRLVIETAPAWGEPYAAAEYRHPDPQYLRNALSASTLAELKQLVESLHISPAELAPLKPQWIHELILDRRGWRAGFGSGVDDHLWIQTSLPAKPRETLGGLAATAVAEIPTPEAETFFREVLERYRAGAYFLQWEEISQHWRDGDREALHDYLLEHGLDPNSADYRQLVSEREVRWLPKLIAYVESPETELVIVDVVHLTGPGNLLERLEAEGFTVTQY